MSDAIEIFWSEGGTWDETWFSNAPIQHFRRHVLGKSHPRHQKLVAVEVEETNSPGPFFAYRVTFEQHEGTGPITRRWD